MTNQPNTLLVIHHSHTDIGYTELQQRITNWQVDYIRQALAIIENRSRVMEPFRWTCEVFWTVERFWEHADEPEKKRFVAAVQNGKIGLSATYLNFSEILSLPLLKRLTARARTFADAHDLPLNAAMTADINGFGQGFAEALTANGIDNLFTCIHTHHTLPAFPRHFPFWWLAPNGRKLLIWHGEHYHFGNELGLAPSAVSSYLTKDECDADTIYHDHWKVAELRIPRLWTSLQKNGYPFPFLPVMISGLRTDNAPPNGEIASTIDRWNQTHGDRYPVKMSTLDEFFDLLRRENLDDLPSYRGDWPDWWTDGVASMPASLRLYRKAQRNYRRLLQLSPQIPANNDPKLRKLEDNLALYAEHTYGHSFSIHEPWYWMSQAIQQRKQAYAAEALDLSEELLDREYDKHGNETLRSNRPFTYRVINPLQHPLSGTVELTVGHFEFYEHHFEKGAVIRDSKTGKVHPHQFEIVPRGVEYRVNLHLQAHEQLDLEIIPTCEHDAELDEHGLLKQDHPWQEGLPDLISNRFVSIGFDSQGHIVSWVDHETDLELIDPDAEYPALALVHELVPMEKEEDVASVRSSLGPNRKTQGCRREISKFLPKHRCIPGELYDTWEFPFEMEEISHGLLRLQLVHGSRTVRMSWRVNKSSRWEPENLYVSLPFRAGDDDQLWLDKPGGRFRPGVDQLPGTLRDYYSVEDGIIRCREMLGLTLTLPDTALIWLGELDQDDSSPHLADGKALDREALFAWWMTNYWETNFEASLGGFHECRCRIEWGNQLCTPDQAVERLKRRSIGLISFRIHQQHLHDE